MDESALDLGIDDEAVRAWIDYGHVVIRRAEGDLVGAARWGAPPSSTPTCRRAWATTSCSSGRRLSWLPSRLGTSTRPTACSPSSPTARRA